MRLRLLLLGQFLPFVFFLQDLVSIFGTATLADGQILAKRIFLDHEALLQSFLHDSLAMQRLFRLFLLVALLSCVFVLSGLCILWHLRLVLSFLVRSFLRYLLLLRLILFLCFQFKTACRD